jgi:peroxiredoxin
LALLGISILGVFCFVVFRATRQLPSSHGAPTVDQKAPDFTLRDNSPQPGFSFRSSIFSTGAGHFRRCYSRVLLIFIAAIGDRSATPSTGIEEQLPALKNLGIRPVAISVDAPEESADLCRKAAYTYTFLSDPNAEVIRRYDLLHAGAGVNDHDIARPAEFRLDSLGIVRWVNLTKDLRVRATPDEMLKAARALH